MDSLEPSPAATTAAASTPAKHADWFVISSGLITTALALLAVYLISSRSDVNPMGWHLNYIIPAGAIGVGLVAGCGYGIASWLTGVKITRGVFLKVLLLQCVAYGLAEYVEFQQLHLTFDNGQPVGFFEYFDYATRNFSFTDEHGHAGSVLGLWGYAVRGLELVGFAIGGVIAPAILSRVPYCESCQVYMKTRSLGLLPAGTFLRKVKKSDVEGLRNYEAEQRATAEEGQKLLDESRELALKDDAAAFTELFARFAAQKKEISKRLVRIEGRISHCPRCHFGSYRPRTIAGQGKEIKTVDLPATDLPPSFIESLIHLPGGK